MAESTRGRTLPRGLLRREVDPEVVLMMCTAGHVDHGKTALVRLLTGCNTDRLKAEQERGLTIELGFAPCFLGGTLCAGIVDVPGHEKFVRTMVSGVSGIDLTVLVIAADDGIMPQTVEHLQIMDLLGVRHGLVALTKIDLVSPDRVEEVAAEIRTFLKGTFLDGAPVCPVSSETLEGYDTLYDTLVDTIRSLGRGRRAGLFRMPIERVFTKQGFGSVAIGIPVDGMVHTGDEVEIVPGGLRSRVRGIQRFLRDATEGGYGQCLALNLPLLKTPPERGQVVCVPGALSPGRTFHVLLKTISGLPRAIQHAEDVKFHTGTTEANAKVYLLEGKTIGGGEAMLASVITTEPIAAAPHDRFMLRRPSPAVTVGGGEILAVSQADHRMRKTEIAEPLRAYLEILDGIDPGGDEGLRRRSEWQLRTARTTGATPAELALDLMIPPVRLKEILPPLLTTGRVLVLGQRPGAGDPSESDLLIHSESLKASVSSAVDCVKKAQDAGILSLPADDLRGGEAWPSPLWTRVQEELRRQGLGDLREGRFVLTATRNPFSPVDRDKVERLFRIYEESGFHSPRPEEAAARLGLDPARFNRFLEHLCNEGRLVRLSPAVILSRSWFAKAQGKVIEIIRAQGTLDSADFKGHIQSSRKYALAILDYLDTRRVTLRVGNLRKLAPDFERNLL